MSTKSKNQTTVETTGASIAPVLTTVETAKPEVKPFDSTPKGVESFMKSERAPRVCFSDIIDGYIGWLGGVETPPPSGKVEKEIASDRLAVLLMLYRLRAARPNQTQLGELASRCPSALKEGKGMLDFGRFIKPSFKI